VTTDAEQNKMTAALRAALVHSKEALMRDFQCGALVVAAIAAVVVASVWLTGSTFGQRCEARGHAWNTPAHDQCVQKLVTGK
jgi:hypothetical protein